MKTTKAVKCQLKDNKSFVEVGAPHLSGNFTTDLYRAFVFWGD